MLYRNMFRKYMTQANDGSEGGGGGDQPAATPEADKPSEEPQEQGDPAPQGDPKPEQDPKPKDDNKDLPSVEDTKSELGKVTSLIEDAGLNMKEVAELVKANDGKIDLDTMLALKEKHGDAVASLIADQLDSIYQSRKAEAVARDKEIFDLMEDTFKDMTEQSGEETWKELSAWAKDNVPVETRKELNAMLSQGGLAAKLAAQELATAFRETSGAKEYQDADLLDGDSTPPVGGGFISKQEYTMELNKLLAEGHVYGQSQKIAQLDQRRAKSLANGY